MLKNTGLYFISYAISILAFAYETLYPGKQHCSTAVPQFYYRIETTRKATRMTEDDKRVISLPSVDFLTQGIIRDAWVPTLKPYTHMPVDAPQSVSDSVFNVMTSTTSTTEEAIPGGLERVFMVTCQGNRTKGCRGKQVAQKLPAGDLGRMHEAQIRAAMLGWQHVGGYWLCPHCAKEVE